MTYLGLPVDLVPIDGGGPFHDLFGTVYYRPDGQDIVVAVHVTRRLLNPWGMMHGGALATFADIALGYGIALSADAPIRRVTASLHLEYMQSAGEGDWIEAHVKVQKRGNKLAFAHCDVRTGTRQILHASAIFSAVGGGKLQPAERARNAQG